MADFKDCVVVIGGSKVPIVPSPMTEGITVKMNVTMSADEMHEALSSILPSDIEIQRNSPSLEQRLIDRYLSQNKGKTLVIGPNGKIGWTNEKP